VDEPWIPAVDVDGNTRELGIRDVLLEAHRLWEIRDPMPTVEYGLYRLLTAFVLDIHEFGNDDLYTLGELIDGGQFDAAVVNRYLDRYRDRFDLFDKAHPFLQTPGMTEEPASSAALAHAIPSGSNQMHFHHQEEDDFRVGPAAAARLLTTLAPFTTAGGRGYSPSINGAPPWYVLVLGGTLFQTLCLNAYVLPAGVEDKNTGPAWRNQRQPDQSGRRTTASLLEALTWRPRRIQLIPGEPGACAITGEACDVTIGEMRFTAGDSCDFTSWRDPSASYRTVDKKGVYSLRPQEGKQLWRETAALSMLTERDYKGDDPVRLTRPQIIDQYKQLRLNSRTLSNDDKLNLAAYGIRTDQMKVFEWRREELSVPFELVFESSLHRVCQDEIDKADEIASKLKFAIKRTFPRRGEGAQSAQESIFRGAQQTFWDALRIDHTAFLGALAAAGTNRDTRNAAVETWRNCVKRRAWACLSDAIDHLDTDDEALRRWADARGWFSNQLREVYKTPEEKLADKKRRAKKNSSEKGEEK
jgi:CRISPR system Cascade subunit CasA